MKKMVLVCLWTLSQSLAANGLNPGSSMTLGPSVNHFSVFSGTHNPAMAPLLVPEGETWRINLLPSMSLNVEIGDVDNFADDLDELIDLIDDPSSNTDSATETLERFNAVLVQMGQQGYIKNSAHISIPITPLYYYSESLEGTFFVDASMAVQASVRVLDDVLRLDDQSQSFTTNTSLYVKSGVEKKISAGFGRRFFSDNKKLAEKGSLYAGATLSVIDLELSKQVTRLEDLDGQDVSDVIRDEYDSNLNSNLGVSVDLGLVWDADWYRAGLVLKNLNSPSFSYGAVGVNCEDRAEASIERNSCEISRRFIDDGRLKAREEHKMHMRIRSDGLLKITDRWFVSSSVDLATYDDIVGDENQWWTVAMSYDTEGKWAPASRLGFQKNLAGSKLSSVVFGFTFFEALALDFEWGTETVSIDGDSAPRRLGLAISFEENF